MKLLAIVLFVGMGAIPTLFGQGASAQEGATMTIQVSSSAFVNEQPIPATYSCKGDNISPPLAWSGVPAGTKSLALIMDDPDAPSGTFVHWVVFNIPPTRQSFDANIPPTAADIGVQGLNGRHDAGYTGPCPPWGKHRYYFKVYALDTMLQLSSEADKRALVASMQSHILAQGQLMGTFSK